MERSELEWQNVSETLAPERILIVDDHPLVRAALRSVLSIVFDKCELLEAGNIAEADKQLTRESSFDLVLLDLNIPDANGLEGLKCLREKFPIIPIIMVSGEFDSDTVRRAIDIGASGFIPKSLQRSEIVTALNCVISGEIYLPDVPFTERVESDTEREINRKIGTLTVQQRVVLGYLMQGQLNKQIAYELDVSMTTVKAHVSAILQKLQVSSRTQAVITANCVHFEPNQNIAARS